MFPNMMIYYHAQINELHKSSAPFLSLNSNYIISINHQNTFPLKFVFVICYFVNLYILFLIENYINKMKLKINKPINLQLKISFSCNIWLMHAFNQTSVNIKFYTKEVRKRKFKIQTWLLRFYALLEFKHDNVFFI